jgi:hypothetical protein
MRIQFAPIPKLITAEGTVIDGTSKEAKQTTQRIVSPAVDSIHVVAPYRQLAVVAKWALTPALEDGDGRPVEI